MSDLILTARMVADAKGLIGEVRVSKGELDKLTAATGRAGTGARGAGRDFDHMGGSARKAGRDMAGLHAHGSNVTGMFLNMRNAIATLGLGLLVRDIYQTGNAFDGYRSTLLSVAGTTNATAVEMAYVRAEADRLGLALGSTTEQYSQIAAATKETVLQGQPARDIFEAVSESMVVLNKSAADTSGALTAITQVISKGKVQAEELRGQLGERIPGAFLIAARAMGVSTQQLDKMLELGQVTAEDFLPKFAAELRKTYGEALPSATRRASSEWNRMMNVIADRQNTAFTSGFGETLARELREITDLLKGPEIEAAAASFGELLATGTSLASDGLQFLVRHGEEALAVLAGIAAVKTASVLVDVGIAAGRAAIGMAAFAATPVGLVAIGIGLATAALVAFGDETLTVRDKTATATDYAVSAWNVASENIVAGWGWIADASTIAWQAAEEYAAGGWSAKLGNVWISIAASAKIYVNGLIAALASIGDIVSILTGEMFGDFKWVFESIGKYYDWFLERAAVVADKVAEFFGKATDLAKDALTEIGKGAAEAVGEQKLGEQISDKIKSNFDRNWLGELWTETADLATPVIDDVAKRAAARYRARLAEGKPVAEVVSGPGIPNKPGASSGGPVITEKQQNDHERAIKRIRKGYLDLLPPQERNIAAAKLWYDEAIKGLDANQAGYAEFKKQADEIYDHLLLQGSTDWHAGIVRGFRTIGEEADDMASQTERALNNLNRAGENTFVGLMRGTTSLSSAFTDMANSIIDDILRMMYQQQIAAPIAGFAGNFLTDFLGNMFGGSTAFDSGAGHYNGVYRPGTNYAAVGSFHSGGLGKEGGENPRIFPMAMFDNAPRFHSGKGPDTLKPGEIPAILEKDEEVLTSRHPRHRNNFSRMMGMSGGGSGGPDVIVVEPKINLTLENRGQDMEQPQAESRGQRDGMYQLYALLKPMIADDIAHGPLGRQIRNQFGARESLIGRS